MQKPLIFAYSKVAFTRWHPYDQIGHVTKAMTKLEKNQIENAESENDDECLWLVRYKAL